MATTLQTIITRSRRLLLEETPRYWSDTELLEFAINGAQDLWKAVIDVFQDHFFTLNATSTSMAANVSTLSGVPDDCFRVSMIEPRDVTDSVVAFVPRKFQSVEFQAARRLSQSDYGSLYFYDIIGQGPPVDTMQIHVAPTPAVDLPLTLGYIRNVPSTLTTASTNPIPGDTDLALVVWTVAYARAKQREDGSPDPEMLAIYNTEKQGLITVVTPRQEQSPEYVEGFLEGEDF